MSAKKYEIRTVEDFAKLTKDQRVRCAQDLVAWADFIEQARPLDGLGITVVADVMTWRDDYLTGKVTAVQMTDKDGNNLGRAEIKYGADK